MKLVQKASESEKAQHWMNNKHYPWDIKKVVVWIWNYSVFLLSPLNLLLTLWLFHEFSQLPLVELRPVILSVRQNSSSKYLGRSIS